MAFKNYYEILGIASTATTQEIKLSYRKLAKIWHPDKNTQAKAKSYFQYISEAYQILSNPVKRQTYDMSYWGQVLFQDELATLQQEIDTMIRLANAKREKAHQKWMSNFEKMWTSKMAQA
ncbi:hypothetical protein BKI52_06350 [marine bacterium AO1-C]|nr:hypothetical protein BKI52_06350 [marine bacterium AO1-C]